MIMIIMYADDSVFNDVTVHGSPSYQLIHTCTCDLYMCAETVFQEITLNALSDALAPRLLDKGGISLGEYEK